MIIDSYDINSEPIVKLENFYVEKQHLVKKCMEIGRASCRERVSSPV